MLEPVTRCSACRSVVPETLSWAIGGVCADCAQAAHVTRAPATPGRGATRRRPFAGQLRVQRAATRVREPQVP
jgi:hypothetical protein